MTAWKAYPDEEPPLHIALRLVVRERHDDETHTGRTLFKGFAYYAHGHFYNFYGTWLPIYHARPGVVTAFEHPNAEVKYAPWED